MATHNSRLYFLDAIRAFAIIMMLQGHFVHALLGDEFRDRTNTVYLIWEYFRGMTAPTFFTITGFIFTFLLIKNEFVGLENPRVLKGIKRAVKVIFWGYLLRLSLFAIFKGSFNPSFFYVDVLQCIGTSLLLLIGVYLLFYKKENRLFQRFVVLLGVSIFILEPLYDTLILEFLPVTIANYFTSKNGSIFTLLPWFGYVCFGSYFATLFLKHKDSPLFYKQSSWMLFFVGVVLIFFSSSVCMLLYTVTDISIFKMVAYNNFLFIRLGNVLVLFSVFLFCRDKFTDSFFTKIGGRTLSIYILHFFVLYGSWFGLGLSRYLYHTLSPIEVTIGAILFVIGICSLVLSYYKNEVLLKQKTELLYIYITKIAKKVILPSWYTVLRISILKRVVAYKRARRINS